MLSSLSLMFIAVRGEKIGPCLGEYTGKMPMEDPGFRLLEYLLGVSLGDVSERRVVFRGLVSGEMMTMGEPGSDSPAAFLV
jgi:hypothetical protein